MPENKIKKAVIREDLLSITKDYHKAILLNQFIYWSERVSDADKFIEKENEIAKNNGEAERELFYGWIYKTAEELADEVMLGLSASQIRRYINDLVDLGYLSKRNNPKYKWDRTLQYRVNLAKIAKDLKKNGFPLSDYKIVIPDDENTNAHPCAINSEPEENQSQFGECAIPENINKDCNTKIKNKKPLSVERAASECVQEPDKPKSKPVNRKKEANELFDRLWSLYPLKKGKASVSDTQKLKLLDIGYEEMERATERYKQYVDSVDYLHYKNGSTFFNSGYIDYLDENYVDYGNSAASKHNRQNDGVQKPEVREQNEESYKSKLEKAKQKAAEMYGEQYREEFWQGMEDGEIQSYLELLGIFLDEIG